MSGQAARRDPTLPSREEIESDEWPFIRDAFDNYCWNAGLHLPTARAKQRRGLLPWEKDRDWRGDFIRSRPPRYYDPDTGFSA